MNHILEVVAVQHVPVSLEKVTRLDKDRYVVHETGEVCEYRHSENRGQNIAGLKKTFKKIRQRVNANFCGAENELFLTLTYAENMTDPSRLYRDFDRFMKQLRYRYGDVSYFSVVEPQERGAWHCHVLLRLNGRDRAFVPHKELESMWGHGWVWIRRLQGVDNIGAYLSAYLADLELTPETAGLVRGHEIVAKEVTGREGKKQSKRFIKGGRCHLYPPGMNLYRHSRDVRQPVTEEMPYSEIKRIAGACSPDYGCSVTISDDYGKQLNQITYQNFNLKRTKKQEVICVDATTGIDGVPCGTADSGQLAQDGGLLPEQYRPVHEVCRGRSGYCIPLPAAVAGVLSSPSGCGSFQCDAAILCPGAPGFPDVELYGGFPSVQPLGEVSASQGTAQGD